MYIYTFTFMLYLKFLTQINKVTDIKAVKQIILPCSEYS